MCNTNTELFEVYLQQPVGPLGLLVLPGCESLASEINDLLVEWRNRRLEINKDSSGKVEKSYIIPAIFPRFSSGESCCRIEGNIDNSDVYILCDLFNYNVTYSMRNYYDIPMSPDEHYANLKRAISAINGHAKRITVIMPMLYEGRQSGNYVLASSDCKDMLRDLYYNLGVDSIITVDIPDIDIVNYIPNKLFYNYQPFCQMIRTLLKSEEDIRINRNEFIVACAESDVSNRGAYYSKYLDLDLGILYFFKPRKKIVGCSYIKDIRLSGKIKKGQNVILVTDIITSGEDIVEYAYTLKEKGAGRIFVFATFGLFDCDTYLIDDAYEKGLIDRIFCSNLTYINEEIGTKKWYVPVKMDKFLAVLIDRLNYNCSIEQLLDQSEKIKNSLDKYN